MKKIFQIIMLSIVWTLSFPVVAAMLSLSPSATSIDIDSTLLVDVNMDFSDDPTLGGAIDVLYDSNILDFVSFQFDPTFPTDLAFSSPGGAGNPDDLLGVVRGIGFGNFSGLSGPARVGTLVFSAIGVGVTNISMAENVLPLGGFFSADGTREIDPELLGTSVAVTAVPLPSALWLFISAIVGVFGVTRRSEVLLK